MDRRTKEQVAAELHEKLKDFKLAVLTGYSGMDVAKMTALRVILRKSNAELRVVKNSLLAIASRETDFGALEGQFKGPLAVAITHGDVVETTKAFLELLRRDNERLARLVAMAGLTCDFSSVGNRRHSVSARILRRSCDARVRRPLW